MTKRKSLIVLICGGSGSGKSTLAGKFQNAAIISTDNFYRGISRMTPLPSGEYDFDDPSAVDLVECRDAALSLAEGCAIEIPIYDMQQSERVGMVTIQPPESHIVVVEGIFALHEPLREIGQLKIFIDTPMAQRVARRINRDSERGRSEMDSLERSYHVETMYQKHIKPVMQFADMILGREGW